MTDEEEFIASIRLHLADGREGYIYHPNAGWGRVGLVFRDGHIYTMPGGYTLLRGCVGYGILGLDFLHELPDPILTRVRKLLVVVLEERKDVFIPLGYQAFSRIRVDIRQLTLVDRVGLECVFSYEDRYYISGYDHNENPPLYFLARLPGKVKTYKQAIESLKPRSVKLAEKQGLKVLRQGDMFAIPTEYTTKKLERKGAKCSNRMQALYGTGHYAQATAQLPDGTMFGSGGIYHYPSGRLPDHHPLPLPDNQWYLIVKNTVPIQERR